MKRWACLLPTCGLMAALPWAMAQQEKGRRDAPAPSRVNTEKALESRLFRFDANHDGKLTRAEVTDERLHRLFDRADANHDGVVTKPELAVLAAREPVGGRGGPGGPGGFGMGPPRPGDILPPMLRDRLELNEEQRKQVDALQKEVDAKLAKILSEEQNKQLRQIRERGPGGFGPPGGFGGPGGPGGRRRGPGAGPPPDRPE